MMGAGGMHSDSQCSLMSQIVPIVLDYTLKWLQVAEFSLFSDHLQSWLTDFYLHWMSLFESDRISYIGCYSKYVSVTKWLSSTTRARKLAVWRELTRSLKSAYLHHDVLPWNWIDELYYSTDALLQRKPLKRMRVRKKSHHVHHASLEKLWLHQHIWHSLNVWPFRWTNGLCKNTSSERLLKTSSLEWRDEAFVFSHAHTFF